LEPRDKKLSDRVLVEVDMAGILVWTLRVVLPTSPSRVESCIIRLLSEVDVFVRIHQLLRSSLSFDKIG
jgi:hypothetical protein